MGDGNRAGIDPDLVSVHVVAMMVGVEREPDGFVGHLPDLGDHFLGALGEVPVDDQDEVLEDHPPLVAVSLVEVPLVEVDAGGDFLHLAHAIAALRQRKKHGKRERQPRFHGEPS